MSWKGCRLDGVLLLHPINSLSPWHAIDGVEGFFFVVVCVACLMRSSWSPCSFRHSVTGSSSSSRWWIGMGSLSVFGMRLKLRSSSSFIRLVVALRGSSSYGHFVPKASCGLPAPCSLCYCQGLLLLHYHWISSDQGCSKADPFFKPFVCAKASSSVDSF